MTCTKFDQIEQIRYFAALRRFQITNNIDAEGLESRMLLGEIAFKMVKLQM